MDSGVGVIVIFGDPRQTVRATILGGIDPIVKPLDSQDPAWLVARKHLRETLPFLFCREDGDLSQLKSRANLGCLLGRLCDRGLVTLGG